MKAQTYMGKACRRGHSGLRYASSGHCVPCLRLSSIAFESTRDNSGRSRDPKRKARVAAWRWANADRYAALTAKGHAKARNPDCIPPGFDVEATISFYAEARRLTRETGIPHHVDHIVPLSKGGVHAAYNLQVLPARKNVQKGDAVPVNPLTKRV